MKGMNTAYLNTQVITRDGLRLAGNYLEGDRHKTAVLFIHGFTTDFYTMPFYHVAAERLRQANTAILFAQTRGTGVVTEIIKEDFSNIFLGSYYERLEEAHIDITAHIEFLLSEGYQKITLMGHSLGTLKVTRYLFEGEHKGIIEKLILLSPFDKDAYMLRKLGEQKFRECVKVAEQKVAEGRGREIVPVPEFEDYAMSYQTYVSWYTQSELNSLWDFYRKENEFLLLQQINIPVKVIIGGEDDFLHFPEFEVTIDSALAKMKQHIQHCEVVVLPGCEHIFTGFEDQLAEEVVQFLR
jgi:pimeloyl-ACP methyl ester carboxylesterase